MQYGTKDYQCGSALADGYCRNKAAWQKYISAWQKCNLAKFIKPPNLQIKIKTTPEQDGEEIKSGNFIICIHGRKKVQIGQKEIQITIHIYIFT